LGWRLSTKSAQAGSAFQPLKFMAIEQEAWFANGPVASHEVGHATVYPKRPVM
jgi:hypothetical protein